MGSGEVSDPMLNAGDWSGWVGTWDDLEKGNPGQYVVRVMDNKKSHDTTYPGVEILPDGTFVTVTYGHWTHGESPYIMCSRFTLQELDAKAKRASKIKLSIDWKKESEN